MCGVVIDDGLVREVEESGGRAQQGKTHSSDTMYSSKSLRMSTPPPNRQLNILISNSKHRVDGFVGELTF